MYWKFHWIEVSLSWSFTELGAISCFRSSHKKLKRGTTLEITFKAPSVSASNVYNCAIRFKWNGWRSSLSVFRNIFYFQQHSINAIIYSGSRGLRNLTKRVLQNGFARLNTKKVTRRMRWLSFRAPDFDLRQHTLMGSRFTLNCSLTDAVLLFRSQSFHSSPQIKSKTSKK